MVNSLTKYIEQSDILGRNEASELEILKEKYPFFQALHILIAKSHKNQNTFGFNKNLRIASMYAGDRRILYNFINYETEKSEIVKIETSPENETVENNLHENNVDLINEKETQQIIEPEHEITNEIQQKPEQNIDIEIVEEFVIDSEIEKKENSVLLFILIFFPVINAIDIIR